MWVSLSTTYWSLVVQPPPFTCAGYAPPLCQTKKAILFVYLSWLFYPLQCVCSLSLSIPHGMHLVVPTHPCFFWVACHPNKTFPPKEPEQEPQNRFFPSLHCQTMPPLTSDPWPTTSYIGWWCQGLAHASPSSPVAHAFAVIYRLVCTFCRAHLPSYGVGCFLICHSLWLASFWGLGLVGSWAFPPPAYSIFTLCPC